MRAGTEEVMSARRRREGFEVERWGSSLRGGERDVDLEESWIGYTAKRGEKKEEDVGSGKGDRQKRKQGQKARRVE
jgi:hypothetical protein